MTSSRSKLPDGDRLEVRNLSYEYDGLPVLRNLELSVPAGQGVAVLGPSGCGKSTLLHIIAGLLEVQSGTVDFDGESMLGRPGWISYMQQDDLLLPWKNLSDNISLPLILSGISKQDARSEVHSRMKEFGLNGFENHFPDQLSGGMRQRAAFMRSSMFRQDFLLLDEPFSRLDFLTRADMHQWFFRYLEDHSPGFILVTHDPREAILLCDRVVVLSSRPATVVDVVEIDKPRSRDPQSAGDEAARQSIERIIAKAH